jgi:hypothetical protein
MNRRWLMIVLALATAVAACGSDNEVLGLGDRDLDRCSLITVEEAEDWLGAPVEAATSEGLDGEADPVTCYYEGANGSILLQVYDGAVFFAEPGSPARLGEDVAGLGEDAFRDNDSVKFLQNDWSASVSQISGVADIDHLMEMAELMSERLP